MRYLPLSPADRAQMLATIGAGSTITKDAVAEKLTLARSKQLTLEGWQRPVKKPKE